MDIDTGRPLGSPKRFIKGYLTEMPEDLGRKGGQSAVELVVVSNARDLTRALPLTRSNEELKKRNPADRFREHSDVAGEWTVPWGQAG